MREWVDVLVRATAERATPRKRSTRRMWSTDRLPMPRAFFYGPRWRRHFGVSEVPIVDIAPEAAKYHRHGRKLLIFSLEEDVRELICEPIYHDKYAMWSDPREGIGR